MGVHYWLHFFCHQNGNDAWTDPIPISAFAGCSGRVQPVELAKLGLGQGNFHAEQNDQSWDFDGFWAFGVPNSKTSFWSFHIIPNISHFCSLRTFWQFLHIYLYIYYVAQWHLRWKIRIIPPLEHAWSPEAHLRRSRLRRSRLRCTGLRRPGAARAVAVAAWGWVPWIDYTLWWFNWNMNKM